MLSYWFYPNPGNVDYAHPKIVLLFAFCLFLLTTSFAIGRWRKKHKNSVTKKLSRSWSGSLRWFAIIGLFLIVCRVEEIQFFAMRFMWILLILAFVLYILFQVWIWKKKHYTPLPKSRTNDPREKYLPGRG